jgi:exodeoxyribonuclease V beta subunit
LHDLLERQAHRQWQPLQIESHLGAANHSNQPWWTDQAHRLGIAPDQHLPLAQWVNAIMMQPIALPRATKPIVLSQLQPQHFASEMGFTLPVGQLAASKLDQIIQHHIWPGHARAPLQDSLLHGMLTGFIDLVVQHEEVYYVLDYKSNRMPQYTAKHMQQAMLAHRYDVQCTLYMLALHRLLRSRLPAYDPTLHLGHGMYWFIRGVHEPQAGALHCLVPLDLILELDHLITPQP